MNTENPILEVIQQTESRFNAIAPDWMKYDTEKGFAIQILKNNQYLMQIAQNNPASLQQAITNVAAIGLSLNPAEKLAYLLSRNVKVNGPKGAVWESRIYLEPSYMGLCKLATDTGSIDWVQAATVHANDTFVYHGPGNPVTHEIKGDNEFTVERGEIVGFYCTAKTAKGDYLTERMKISDILAIRDRSESWKAFKENRAKTGGPWQTDFEEQGKKTVVRRGFKMWPKTSTNRLAQAITLSNENEGFEPIVTTPSYQKFSLEQKEYFDQMIEQNDSLGMTVFSLSIDEQTFINLYHSFPKGEKGKYQKIVDAMTEKGNAMLHDYMTEIQEALRNNDHAGFNQYLSELDEPTIEIIKARLDKEEKSMFLEMAEVVINQNENIGDI